MRGRMTDNAQTHLRDIGEAYVKDGYPTPNTWGFSPSDETGALAFRELAAHGYIERFARGWRLASVGIRWVLNAHPMTDEAKEELRGLREAYTKDGYPNHKVWSFSPSDEASKATFQELYSRGYIKPMALGHKTWTFTDDGQKAILTDT